MRAIYQSCKEGSFVLRRDGGAVVVVEWGLLEKGEKGKGHQLAEMLRAVQVERAGSRDRDQAGYPLPLVHLHPGKTLHLGGLLEACIGPEEAAPGADRD